MTDANRLENCVTNTVLRNLDQHLTINIQHLNKLPVFQTSIRHSKNGVLSKSLNNFFLLPTLPSNFSKQGSFLFQQKIQINLKFHPSKQKND